MSLLLTGIASITGVAITSVTLTILVLTSDLFTVSCPNVLGRPCNGRGYCGDYGRCQCDPQFSGQACEITLCPGYDASSGHVCSGRGLCSPFMLPEHRPDECATDWGSEACRDRVNMAWSQMEEGMYLLAEGMPICACMSPYTGVGCARNACPMNSDFAVCGGNGNTSVGIVRNDTTTGTGCQCQRHLSIAQLAGILTSSELILLSSKYVDSFAQGVCGTPTRTGSTLIFAQRPDDMRCYCDAQHEGATCEFGVCPLFAGKACGGHGNPELGFERRDGCLPVCAPGRVLCRGTACMHPEACTTGLAKCPAEKPWRCATRECVSGEPACERGYTEGSWDDLSSLGHAVSCTPATVRAEFTALRSLRRTEACFGLGAVLTDAGFQTSTLPIVLPSRLLAVEIHTRGEVQVTYGGVLTLLQGESPLRFSAVRTEREVWEDRYTPATLTVLMTRLSPDRILLHPSPRIPFPDTVSFRVHGVDQAVTGTFLQEVIEEHPDGTFFVARASNTTIIRADGTVETGQGCTRRDCLWNVSTMRAVNVETYVCASGEVFTWSAVPCPSEPGPVRVRIGMVMQTEWTSDIIEGVAVPYDTYKDPEMPELTIVSTSPVTEIKYLLEQDVRRACVCPPFGQNRSVMDYTWLAEREVTTNRDDWVVGRREVAPGVLQTQRGQWHTLELVGPATRITEREAGLGTYDADRDAFPVRCANGAPSTLVWAQISPEERCTCTIRTDLKTCVCKDEFGDERECTGPDCGVDFAERLNERCFWEPRTSQPIPAAGFALVAPGNWTSWVGLPLEITLSEPCNQSFLSDLPMFSKDGCTLYPELGLDEPRRAFFILTNVSVRATMYEDWGGRPAAGTVDASSALDAVQAVRTTSRSTWRSDPKDHPAFISYTFPNPTELVAVFLDVRTAGVYTPTIHIPVRLAVHVKVAEEWTTVAEFTSSVVNGTDRRTVRIPPHAMVTAVRVWSAFPLEIRTFVPLVVQNCTKTKVSGPDPHPILASLLAHPPRTDPGCICEDSCILAGVNQTLNAVCQDQICPPGTDCTDCQGVRCATEDEKRLLPVFQGSLADEYVHLAGATATFTIQRRKDSRRWTRPLCVHECPLHTCEDGRCVDVPSACTPLRKQCPKDGCVRSTIDDNRYKCACAQGRGGLACELTTCTPGDPETGLVSPHRWCTCNGPSPLKIRPPYELVVQLETRAFTDADVAEINRPAGRLNSRDVGWVNIRAEKAPYAVPFLRLHSRNGTVFYTNCPYRVRSHQGLFFELEECVASRESEPPYAVLEWLVHSDGQVIQWTRETEWDDAPYRCPTGHCVARERDCYAMKKRDPMCGHVEALCLVDGTCTCPFGKLTFVLTSTFTERVLVPYAHVGTVMRTTVWGEENENRYVNEWCRARNCTEVDCSPPLGCFPGTPALHLMDREISCPGPLHAGKCALDPHDCLAGRVSEPKVCSGNGILKRRDYRPEEWYCDCGAMIDGVFRTNGYGGTHCQDYACQDDPDRVWFARQVPLTLKRYEDRNGLPLPGRWIGPCGATVGANPSDAVEWARCCPGISQLERCSQVPCVIGGTTHCVEADECQGQGRRPNVYTCNGKGKALADGTCSCEEDVRAGTGYTYDLSVYSTKGCYKRVQCGTCNRIPACSDPARWTTFPVLPYLEQQGYMFAVRAGMPPTNESIVRQLVSEHLETVIERTYVNEALEVQSQIRASATTVCILDASETCANVTGMFPCTGSALVYKKTLNVPYSLSGNMQVQGASHLNDRRWQDSLSTSLVDDSLPRSTTGMVFTIQLDKAYTIDLVRLHAVVPAPVLVTFFGTTGTPCQPAVIAAYADFTWHSIECLLQYTAVRHDLVDPDGFAAHCTQDEFSLRCAEWKEVVCEGIPRARVQRASSLEYFPGCAENEVCCLANQDPLEATSLLILGFNTTVTLDEVVLFGHAAAVDPLPPGMVAAFQQFTQQSECVDEIAFFHPSSPYRGRLSFFLPGLQAATHDQAHAVCASNGGVLASYFTTIDTLGGQAREMGEACYGSRMGMGCHVNARNRKEILQPIDNIVISEPVCRQYGCWDTSASTVYFHHDVGDGSQYDVPMLPTQPTWNNFYQAIDLKRSEQNRGRSVRNPLYRRIDDDEEIGVRDPTAYQNALLTGIFTDFFNLLAAFPLSAPDRRGIPAEGESVEFWTNNETCTITFFSVPNCAAWCLIQYGHGGGCGRSCGSSALESASYTVEIGPDNYEQYFENTGNPGGILDHYFNQKENLCQSGQNPIGEDPAFPFGSNYGYGTPFGFDSPRVKHMRSMSIRGKCRVTISGGVQGGYSYTGQSFTEHTRVGSSLHFLDPFFSEIRNAYQGCHGQVYRNSNRKRAECPGYVRAFPYVSNGVFDYNQCGTYRLMGCPFDGVGAAHPYGEDINPLWNADVISPWMNNGPEGPWRDGRECYCCEAGGSPDNISPDDVVTTLKITPLFESHKIRVTPRALHRDVHLGTNEAQLGYLDHPYMPMIVSVRRVQMTNELFGHVRNRNSLLIDDEPVVPTTMDIHHPDFFKHVGTTTVNTDAEIIMPFQRVNDLPLPRRYMQCPECVPAHVGDFRASIEAVDELVMDDGPLLMQQIQSFQGQAIQRKVYVTYMDRLFGIQWLQPLEGLRGTGAYGRILSAPRLLLGMETDDCVEVVRLGVTGDFQYQFRAVRCMEQRLPLCIQDTGRYTAMAGTQCDACGPSARTTFTARGETAFTLFPRASPLTDPLGHAILRAYLQGTLGELVDAKEDVPWDAVRAQLGNVSILFAWDGAREALRAGLSTRPRFASPGAVEDTEGWVDMAMSRWFPFDCGSVMNPDTGVSRRRCAISREHCMHALDFQGSPMSREDMPTLFTLNISHTHVACTRPIHVSQFHLYTDDGPGQPLDGGAEILTQNDETIVLRVLRQNFTWGNTYRRLRVDMSGPFTIVAGIRSSVATGQFRFWAGSQSPTFQTPEVIEYLTGWTSVTLVNTVDVPVDPQSAGLAVMGIEFRYIQLGALLTLTTWRFSNPDTLAVCMNSDIPTYVELPSSMESGAPFHTCDYMEGRCSCAADSPFGGPGCEWPAVRSPDRQKEVCGGYGDTGGMALGMDGLKTALVSTLGVYKDRGGYACKCVDVGLTIRTVMRPTSAFDNAYVFRRDRKPNRPEFIVVQPPADIAVPVLVENVKEVCNSETAALPSWSTGAEIEAFVRLGITNILVDLERRGDEFWWHDREEELRGNETMVLTEPCDDPELCQALNWNNLAYNRTSTGLTDGRDIAVSATPPLTVNISRMADIHVEVWHMFTLGWSLTAEGTACTPVITGPTFTSWDCLGAGIQTLTWQGQARSVREIKVFRVTDTGRAVGYFN